VKPSKAILAAAFALALPLAGALPLQAQRAREPVREEPLRRPRAGQRAGRARIPRNWMQRLRNMPPEQQERFLENNRRFRNLPPDRQAQIRARLKQWDSLTPEQKRILIRRARIFESMSPRERREVRQVILPEWRQLPPARRKVLVGRLRQLQGLNDSQREERLKDPRFVRGLSPRERALLKKISELKVGPGGGNL